ncbi:MAG: GNAT family N-acetyltransferase [Thermoplasmatota archaeon]
MGHHTNQSDGVGHIATIRIDIREATADDLTSVVNLWGMLARHHEDISNDFTLAWNGKRKWAKYLEDKFDEISTKLIVAEEDGKVVGFMLCLLSPNTPVFKERKIGVISDVFVLEERRRKGVTKKMLDVAVKWFKKNKVRSVRLGVANDNLEARAVWRQMGFEPYMIYKRLDLDRKEMEPPVKTKRRKIVKQKKLEKRRGL